MDDGRLQRILKDGLSAQSEFVRDSAELDGSLFHAGALDAYIARSIAGVRGSGKSDDPPADGENANRDLRSI